MIGFDKKNFLKAIRYAFLKLTIVSLIIGVIYIAGFYFVNKTGVVDYRLLKFNNLSNDTGSILIIIMIGIAGIIMLAATLGLILLIIYALIALIVQYLYEKGVLYFTKNDDKPDSCIERELKRWWIKKN
jgi:hypothetical protein